MRTWITIVLALACLFGVTAQDTELVGTWDISKFVRIMNDEIVTTSEAELQKSESVWTLDFGKDQKVTQSSNMRTGLIESQTGTWETEGENLQLNLNFQGKAINLVYLYQIQQDKLLLKRQDPTGALKLEVSFKRKR